MPRKDKVMTPLTGSSALRVLLHPAARARIGTAVAAGLLAGAAASSACAQMFLGNVDPFNTGAGVSSAPNLRWESPTPLPAVPAPPVPDQPRMDTALSLPELTEIALRNNPQTRQAWFAALAAAAGIGIEQAQRLPQLSANYIWQRSESAGQTGTQINWISRWGPSITLTYLLLDFGASANQVRAAEFATLAAALSQNRVLQSVVFQTEQTYYTLLGTDALVRSNELFLKSVETSLDATQRRREAGLATVADVYRAETQVAQAQLNLTRSRGDREKARGALANALGLPVNALPPVQLLDGEPKVGETKESLTDLLARAKGTRPDLIAAEAQAQSARANAVATARAALPTVTVTATNGTTIYDQNRPTTTTNSLLFTLNIPLFRGFGDTYAIRQAQAKASQAEAARDILYQQTELDVWQSYYEVQTAADGIKSTAVQVRAAQQTSEATLARYKAGFGSLLDLITAQVDESNARVQRIQSFLDWFTAVARLYYSVGVNDTMVQAIQQR
jgi:outer membrane protein TolC